MSMGKLAKVKIEGRGCVTARFDESCGAQVGVPCVVEIEFGEVLGRLRSVFDSSDDTSIAFRVVRLASDIDIRRHSENGPEEEKVRAAFERNIGSDRHRVKVLAARYSLDRSRVRIFFGAPESVDLRRYMGQIQRDFKTQVDLCQVGVRDEALLCGGVGVCGRLLCCSSLGVDGEAVSMRMAKVQELAMNPATLNGQCGRPKCCLMYEYEQYSEAAGKLPPTGSRVRTESGELGLVVARDILRSFLTVRFSGGTYKRVAVGEVTIIQGEERK